MTEFRMFCAAFVVGCGLMATAINHGFVRDELSTPVSLIWAGLFFGCLIVAAFGRRVQP